MPPGNVTGGRDVGGLAGGSSGIIRWSFGTGSVDGDSNVGGLVGQNGGRIIASYASGRVVGAQAVGGLVGANNYGAIIASYATGAASGDMSVGGLAGESRHSDVVASYAIGAVAGTHDAGGLIGAGGLTVMETASFWDAQSSGQESSSNGTGKTTDELQGPTAYTGIFADWNVDLDNADGDDDPATGADDFWDFGTSTEYPVLKFDLDGDGAATWQEFGNQARTAIPAADNCLETVPNAGAVAGSWSSGCLSFNRPGSYARYYVFTLDTDSEVFITLQSDDVDTYLYLQEGAGTQSASFQSQGSSDPYSRIEDGFAAGTYTIEATTYEAGQAGSFTLTVHKPGEDDDCVEIMTTVAITGTWSSDCASGRRPESYARFYTFTLTEPSVVVMDLESEGIGAYLYLLRGAGRAGDVLEDYGSRGGSAELGHTLDAGTYTVEVTTYDRTQTGDFTLTVLMAALPPPPPPDLPAPPPEPIPDGDASAGANARLRSATDSRSGGTGQRRDTYCSPDRCAGTYSCHRVRGRLQLPGWECSAGRGGGQHIPVVGSDGCDERIAPPRPAGGAVTDPISGRRHCQPAPTQAAGLPPMIPTRVCFGKARPPYWIKSRACIRRSGRGQWTSGDLLWLGCWCCCWQVVGGFPRRIKRRLWPLCKANSGLRRQSQLQTQHRR